MLPRVWIPLTLAVALPFAGCGKPREPEPFRGGTGSAAPASNNQPGPTPAPASTAMPANANASTTPKPAASDPTSTLPEKQSEASLRGYARNLAAAPVIAAKTIDDSQLNRAVQQFGAMEGRLPTSLEELVTAKYLPEIPKAPIGHRLDYDPNTGKVTVVKVNP